MTSTERELLLVAYQCGPGMGSVSQIGWQWFTGMAARRPVCLVTHIRNRAAIEAAPDRPTQGRVIYIDTEWLAGPLYRFSKRLFPRSEHAVFTIAQLDWFAFDATALSALRDRLKAGANWELLHLVTPVTVSAPTRLHKLGLPVVRGPLNCGLPVPKGFDDLMRQDSMGLARLRVFPRLMEAVVGSLRASAAVLVATSATRDALPRAVQSRSLTMVENAVDSTRFRVTPLPALPALNARPLRVCFVGRLVAVKALPLLLDAMQRLRLAGIPVTLEVAGEGPLAQDWRAHAERCGLVDCVTWLGSLDREGVQQLLRRSHLLCLPSVRESGGAVLLEAMACGRPVVGMDFGGPAEIVDQEVGWKVPVTNAEVATQGLYQALRQAFENPKELTVRGRHARARVLERFTWDAKMDAAENLYHQVLTQRA